jgi:DNA-binding NtrC family response regulator
MTSATVASADRVQSRGGTVTLRGAQETKLEIGVEARLLGRNASCHLALNDTKVSALHAEMVATERGVRVRDLGSRNGTWIGGARVLEAVLSERMSLWLGETELEFQPALPKRVQLAPEEAFGPLFGAGALMRAMFERLRPVAASELAVLIQGETGTGKEVAARAIHQASPRAQGPFVIVDCAALAGTQAEAGLFGHERGAFAGADGAHISPLLEARGGTVLLDELGELPPETQLKLMRTLAESKLKPLGAADWLPIDVRVLAATRRDLCRAVNQGAFRSDLYFRIAQYALPLPPLRERREDIPGLVRHLLHDLGHESAYRRVPAQAFERLIRHDWPGNVTELRGAVAAALTLSGDRGPVDVAAQLGGIVARPAQALGSFRQSRRTTIQQFERAYFEQLTRQCEGNVSEMARRSGLERSHVRRYLKKMGLRAED